MVLQRHFDQGIQDPVFDFWGFSSVLTAEPDEGTLTSRVASSPSGRELADRFHCGFAQFRSKQVVGGANERLKPELILAVCKQVGGQGEYFCHDLPPELLQRNHRRRLIDCYSAAERGF